MKKRVLSALMILLLCVGLMPNAASADVLTEDLPDVDAASYAVIDGDTRQVLFGKDYNKSYDPGSLVQMMTAVLIIEQGNLNDSVTVPEIPEDANDGNRLYLRKGEKISLNSLLEGIIVYNANDAAIAAASHLAGSEEAFVAEMNSRAKELGMDDTTFGSSYGSVKGQTTTAGDMAILAAHASSLPKYVELAIQPTLDWDSEMNQDTVTNVNGMQNVEQQAVGIKTSQGDPINLAASISKGERTVVGVMLDCDSEDNAYLQMQSVMDFGMENTDVIDLVSKDEVVTTLNFDGDKSVRVAAAADYAMTTSQGNSSNYRSSIVINKAELPINAGDEVGVMQVYDGDEVINEVKLIAEDSAEPGFNWLALLTVLLAVALVAVIVLNMLNRPGHPSGGQGGSKKPAVKKPAPKRAAQPARASHPQQAKSGSRPAQPHGKAPAQSGQRAPQRSSQHSANSLDKNALKNPSVGSSAGRQGLEQRLKERTSQDPRGGRR